MYKGFVKDNDEYNTLVRILKKDEDFRGVNRFTRHRLIKKSENFILLNDNLYLKAEDSNHKRVIARDQIDCLRLEA